MEDREVSIDWICARRQCWRGYMIGCAFIAGALDVAKRLTVRVGVERWIRYEADVAKLAIPVPGAALTVFDDAMVARLRGHTDAGQPAFASGLDLWARGLRGGYVWLDEGEPLCSQWLFTERDNAALRMLPEWGSMYPPLPPGVGQVEKLWTFSTQRRRGVASQFAQLMFCEAQRLGLGSLRTHIHEGNAAARMWAQRTGWNPFGTIVRYEFDFPGIRSLGCATCVHTSGSVPA
jgi:hypothetical protein